MNLGDAATIDAQALGLVASDVDPWTGVEVGDGRLRLRRESGAIDDVLVTAPLDGVLRVRVGGAGRASSPMLAGLEALGADATTAPEITPVGHGASVRSGDLVALWEEDGGLSIGALRRASGDGSMGGPALRSGAIVADGRVAGWVDRFRLGPYTGVFGGGESVQGPDLRGRMRAMRNAETNGLTGYDLAYLNVPFLWSPEGWGLFVHCGAAVKADVGATVEDLMSVVVPGEVLDVFVIAGTPAEVLRRYQRITGAPGRMPHWALGTWLSRCSYLSEAELHEVLDDAAAADCPVDVLHVDAWQEGEALVDLACNWAPDVGRFPEGWVQRIEARGARVSLWLNPYVPAGAAAAHHGTAAGLFATTADGRTAESADIPGRLLLDFTTPATLAWWREQVQGLVRRGASAVKPDFGEEVPDDAVFADGRTGAELHNEYALLYQAATHEAFESAVREATGEDDPALAMFCRSGTAGAQRFPCHWVGDSASTWSGMVAALRAALSLSASGFAWVSHDVGGFWTAGSDAHLRASHAQDPSLFTADVDPELFVRWAQWGAFSPVMRFHGAGRREPFAYPGRTGELAVEACRIRARLRPYLELTAARTAATGAPVMVPMAVAYPQHVEAHGALQYLLGADLLVAPVLEPGGHVRLWFPPGTWRQLLGGTVRTGPGWAELRCGLAELPVFVRADPIPGWCRDSGLVS